MTETAVEIPERIWTHQVSRDVRVIHSERKSDTDVEYVRADTGSRDVWDAAIAIVRNLPSIQRESLNLRSTRIITALEAAKSASTLAARERPADDEKVAREVVDKWLHSKAVNWTLGPNAKAVLEHGIAAALSAARKGS